MKERMILKKIGTADRYFLAIDWGSELYGRPTFRLWVAKELSTRDQNLGVYYVSFPVNGAEIVNAHGNLVLKPGDKTVYNIFVPPGRQGEGKLKVVAPEGVDVFPYYVYESHASADAGVGMGALIVAPASPVVVEWTRTGRLFAEPPFGVSIYYPNGDVIDLDRLRDGLEGLKELESLLKPSHPEVGGPLHEEEK